MSFSKKIAEDLMGEEIEVFINGDFGKYYYAEFEVSNNCLIAGRLVDYDENCLILEVPVNTNTAKGIKKVYLNGWSIAGVSKLDKIPLNFVFEQQTARKRR